MNPFKYGRVVSAGDFCPRPELQKQLAGFIRSGQNVVVQGERRVGKTSLICEAVRQSRRRRLLYVDLLEIRTADVLAKRMVKALLASEQQAGFLERIMKALAQLRPTVTIDPVTGQPSVSVDAAVRLQPESIDGLLDLFLTTHRRTPLVVVFDEFQDILHLPDAREVLAILRGKIQFHRDLPYLFAGSVRNQMSEIFSHPGSAFFKSAIALDIGPLPTAAFSRFLSAKFASGRRTVPEEVMARIIATAENVPGDVQELCGALWETTSYRDAITGTNLSAALELIYARENKGYEATLGQLTGQQLKCLEGLARLGGRSTQAAAFVRGSGLMLPASVQKALNRLEQHKIVYRQQNEYKFVNPFFKSWLLWKNY